MRRWMLLGTALVALLAAGAVVADRKAPPVLTRLHDLSLAMQDRQGALLDVRLSKDGMWRLPASVQDVDPAYLRLLLRTEDARFYRHPGVDPLALMRAAWQLLTHGHIVSGGSTLTMQTARLLTPHRHDVLGKLQDVARALQLEAHYTKPQIVAMYLTLAPFGGNVEGVRAACMTWFGHEPSRLSEAEAALLVALPQSPTRLRPDRHPEQAVRAAGRVLARAEPAQVAAEITPPLRHALPREAGYLAVRLQGQGEQGLVRTTLDARLQSALEALAARSPLWTGKSSSMAVLVVSNADRTVLAYLGGSNQAAIGSQVDMVRARRSPGSALKPFIYGLAFDDGLVRPDSLIDDTRMRLGDYAPRDFDRQFHGTVRVSEALQQSYNLPAVQLLERVGPERFVAVLRQAGAGVTLPQMGEAAALPVALGGVGISLQDMAMLYVGLARGGKTAPLRLLASDPVAQPRSLMTAASARQVESILQGTSRPNGTALGGRAVAYKTGTSYGFRDAWAAGFSNAYTVVVWTGRVDGTPVPGAYGRNTAAPVLFQVFDLLPPEPGQEASRMAAPKGRLSPSLVRFAVSSEEGQGPKIVFPPDHSTLELDGQDDRSPITLEAGSGSPPYRWLVDGVPLPQPDVGMPATWIPTGPGFAHLSVVDGLNHEASVDVRLKQAE